jgi:DsbC/DsbD-like thiol-disulfide interchange protein
VPERFEQQGGAVGYGYADTVLLASEVTPAPVWAGPGPVRADVGWLACEKVCVRGTKKLELALAPDVPRDAVDPALFEAWASRSPVDAGVPGAPASLHGRGAVPRDGASGTVAVIVDWTVAPAAVEWFPPDDAALQVESTEARTQGRRTEITFRARRLAGAAMPPGPLAGVLAWRDAGDRRHGLLIPIDLQGGATP